MEPSACGNGALTILVADDDPLVRRLLEKQLQTWGYRVIAVDDGNKAWEVVQSGTIPELIILDWLMPGMDGLELCRRIRDRQHDRYPYVLLISGKDDKRDVIQGLDAGADDYLTKPLDTGELQARLRSGRRILSLQHDLIQAREELRYQATHDGLTGIWSRGAALNLLKCELQRGIRTEACTGILMIDLDHFKNINDTYGHLVGDAVLKEVAVRISHAVRSYDFVGRYGGEEFLAILSDCSADDLRLVAERTRTAVAESLIRVNSVGVGVTVSIGAVVARNGTPEVELLSNADDALYEAKRAGRNRVVITSCHEKAAYCETAARGSSQAG